jgi:cyclic pyranopterin phosphate synthase
VARTRRSRPSGASRAGGKTPRGQAAAPGGAQLTHFDAAGKARMVDVGEKPETERLAVASGFVALSAATARHIAAGRVEKGDVLGIARTAGLMALKRTSELIPLCHPVRVTGADLSLEVVTGGRAPGVRIRAEVRGHDRTGFEMEALTAVSGAALTVYDMVKSAERGARITDIELLEKRGGKSGTWRR